MFPFHCSFHWSAVTRKLDSKHCRSARINKTPLCVHMVLHSSLDKIISEKCLKNNLASLSYSYDSHVLLVASKNLQRDYWRQAAHSSSSFYWHIPAGSSNPDCLDWQFMRRPNTKRQRCAYCSFLSPRVGQRRWKLTCTWQRQQAAKLTLASDHSASLIIVALTLTFPSITLTVNLVSGQGVSELNIYGITMTGSLVIPTPTWLTYASYYNVQKKWCQ